MKIRPVAAKPTQSARSFGTGETFAYDPEARVIYMRTDTGAVNLANGMTIGIADFSVGKVFYAVDAEVVVNG
ncbi:hypothetical protein [Pectobacterium phage PcaP1EGY]